jgi:predicted nucleic acid-binding Zn ribbon protein
MCPEKLHFAWRVAVGPAIDRATTIQLTEAGVVEVRATDPAWRRELKKTERVLEGRLLELLGPGAVKGVKVVGRSPARSGGCQAR